MSAKGAIGESRFAAAWSRGARVRERIDRIKQPTVLPRTLSSTTCRSSSRRRAKHRISVAPSVCLSVYSSLLERSIELHTHTRKIHRPLPQMPNEPDNEYANDEDERAAMIEELAGGTDLKLDVFLAQVEENLGDYIHRWTRLTKAEALSA